MRRLQAVQNAAARLVTGTRSRDHISPVLRQLHWLPAHQRIKLAVLVYKSLYSLAPQYLVEDCELVAAPRLWNSLPSNLRQSDLTLHQFRRALKTYLFCWLGLQHLVTLVFSVLYKCFYLRTCIAPIVSISTTKRSDVDHTDLPANTPAILLNLSLRHCVIFLFRDLLWIYVTLMTILILTN